MGMLWKRCFGQDKKYWRRTYKVGFLLLVKRGKTKILPVHPFPPFSDVKTKLTEFTFSCLKKVRK